MAVSRDPRSCKRFRLLTSPALRIIEKRIVQKRIVQKRIVFGDKCVEHKKVPRFVSAVLFDSKKLPPMGQA